MLTIACLEGEVILGVDTHRDMHAAALVDPLGRAWSRRTVPRRRARRSGADRVGPGPRHAAPRRRRGHRQLRRRPGPPRCALEGVEVIEVTRAARVGGRHRGKNDTRDAEAAARRRCWRARRPPSPRRATGSSNRSGCCATRAPARSRRAPRPIAAAQDLIVTAPDELREDLGRADHRQLVARCARMRRSARRDAVARDPQARCAASPAASRPSTPRSRELDGELAELTAQAAPRLLAQPGVGPEIAAKLLIVAGDNPDAAAQRRRPGRAVRRLPDRGLLRQDRPPPPQPRRQPPSQQRALD